MVASEDDPIVPIASLPLDAMAANPLIVTAVTRHGGHMGYTAGLSPLRHSWVDRILVHYVRHWMQAGGGEGGGGEGGGGGGGEGDISAVVSVTASENSPVPNWLVARTCTS